MPSKRKPMPGRVVSYVLNKEDAETVNQKLAVVKEGDVVPLVVTEAPGDENQPLKGAAMVVPPSKEGVTVSVVPHGAGDEPGKWHWPPNAPEHDDE